MRKRGERTAQVAKLLLSGGVAVGVVFIGVWVTSHPAALDGFGIHLHVPASATSTNALAASAPSGFSNMGRAGSSGSAASDGSASSSGSAASDGSASSNGSGVSLGSLSTIAPITTAPDATQNDPNVQKLQDILDGIAGMQEAALGTDDAGGETITTTIAVAEGTSLHTIEDSLIKQYMADVFSTDPLITSANIYFVDGGEFVAGGGLSRDLYEQWAVSATAGKESDVATWMASLSSATDQGSAKGWFETTNPAAAANSN